MFQPAGPAAADVAELWARIQPCPWPLCRKWIVYNSTTMRLAVSNSLYGGGRATRRDGSVLLDDIRAASSPTKATGCSA